MLWMILDNFLCAEATSHRRPIAPVRFLHIFIVRKDCRVAERDIIIIGYRKFTGLTSVPACSCVRPQKRSIPREAATFKPSMSRCRIPTMAMMEIEATTVQTNAAMIVLFIIDQGFGWLALRMAFSR